MDEKNEARKKERFTDAGMRVRFARKEYQEFEQTVVYMLVPGSLAYTTDEARPNLKAPLRGGLTQTSIVPGFSLTLVLFLLLARVAAVLLPASAMPQCEARQSRIRLSTSLFIPTSSHAISFVYDCRRLIDTYVR